ncbi:MAG: TRAP transporter substrate-binding protein DctP [Deltaproteobacteria bacterium]|nr:TRAP transporter substrate-binding protein DctP [Deltaproteobacteria bacterium]
MKNIKSLAALAIGFVAALIAASAAGAADQPKLKLRLQTHLIPTQTARTLGMFAEQVTLASKGSIEVTVFPVGAILPLKEVLDAVSKGTLDMAYYPEGFWFKQVPVSELGQGVPYAFKNLDQAKTFMWKKGYEELLREAYAKQNVYVWGGEPFPVGLMTKKPIKTLADVKGVKLRATGMMAEFFGRLGASTSVIAAGELYTALATGVVSGAHWGDAGPMYEMKFQEVLKNYMEPEPIQGGWNNFMINLDVWKKMTPEQRTALDTAIRKSAEMGYQSSRNLTKQAIDDMGKKWQVQFNTLSNADQKELEKLSAQLQDEIAKRDPLCAKAIAKLKETSAGK